MSCWYEHALRWPVANTRCLSRSLCFLLSSSASSTNFQPDSGIIIVNTTRPGPYEQCEGAGVPSITVRAQTNHRCLRWRQYRCLQRCLFTCRLTLHQTCLFPSNPYIHAERPEIPILLHCRLSRSTRERWKACRTNSSQAL